MPILKLSTNYAEKKMKRFNLITYLLKLLTVFCLTVTSHAEQKTISIATWGGAYEAAQEQALFLPFTQKTGISITTIPYNGGIEILQQRELPDLISMNEADALRACSQGWLVERDYSAMVAKASTGKTPEADFLPQTFRPCSIAQITFSTVIAYTLDAFPGTKPQTIRDFFDVDRFPGKRGLRKHPDAILEWALMARGVPNNQVYDLLSTERGLRLAIEKLDSIREHIVWWDTPEMPAALLQNGEVVMTSAFNGRIFEAQTKGTPLIILWDGQLVELETWVIPGQQKPPKPEASEFIRFATTAEAQARLAEYIPYGPTRLSAFERIGKHPEHNLPMAAHLPTAPNHLASALFKDSKWSANTATLRKLAFDKWLANDP